MLKSIGNFLSRYTIALIMLFSAWLMLNLFSGKDHFKKVIITDGKGYYAWLPATFIYHDLNFNFFDTIEHKYYDRFTKYDYRSGINASRTDKYFCGESILQCPFFIAGMITTKFSSQPFDGYSRYFALFFCIGALFWLYIGLRHLHLFLRMHGATIGQASFVIALLFFGTNLMYYSIVEPSMSHLYSFSLVSVFLVYAKRWVDNDDTRSLYVMTFVYGLIFITRPVNALIGLWVIFEARSIPSLIRQKIQIYKRPLQFLTTVLLFAIPLLIQLCLYRYGTGKFIVNSYGAETFHFGSPNIFDFLFSFRKGLFIYLPITLISLFGIIPLWKLNRFRAVFAFLFLFIVIYALSCWWMWYYGGSFGTRVMVEYLPIFGLLLFYLLQSLRSRIIKIPFASFLILLALFCQLQTAQYRYGMIHWSDMDKEKYEQVFLDFNFRKLY